MGYFVVEASPESPVKWRPNGDVLGFDSAFDVSGGIPMGSALVDARMNEDRRAEFLFYHPNATVIPEGLDPWVHADRKEIG